MFKLEPRIRDLPCLLIIGQAQASLHTKLQQQGSFIFPLIFHIQVIKIKLHTRIGEGLTGELLSTLQLTGLTLAMAEEPDT